jgi:hypothetical protein
MKQVAEEQGRSATSLEELSTFSGETGIHALCNYPHEFNSTGARRFFLRVNSRFAFEIDAHYQPRWVYKSAGEAAGEWFENAADQGPVEK